MRMETSLGSTLRWCLRNMSTWVQGVRFSNLRCTHYGVKAQDSFGLLPIRTKERKVDIMLSSLG